MVVVVVVVVSVVVVVVVVVVGLGQRGCISLSPLRRYKFDLSADQKRRLKDRLTNLAACAHDLPVHDAEELGVAPSQ